MINKKIIFFLIILIIPLVVAQTININYPEEVSLNEEFNIKIKLIDFQEDTYDVKIDILYKGNRIARILNNEEWESTYYYLNGILKENEEKTFTLKIIEDFDEAEIIIKIRNSVNEVETFQGYNLKKSSSDSEQENNQSSKEQKDNETQESDDSEPEIIYVNQTKNEDNEKNNQVLNTINLNSGKNSQEIIKNDYALYGLIIFAIIIIILLLLRRKKYKNEF